MSERTEARKREKQGSNPFEPSTQRLTPESGNDIWLCGAVSVFDGGSARSGCRRPV
jgi:hypothetical protein